MTDPVKPVGVIDAPAGRTLSNALTVRLLEGGTTEPYATAQQGAGDGLGKRAGILFGFKNGSPGTAVLTYADGRVLRVPTLSEGCTDVVTADGAAVLTIDRGATSTVTAPDGTAILQVVPDPDEPKNDERYRLRLLDGTGAHVATMDVLRVGGGGRWSAEDYVDFADFALGGFVSDGGGSLPMPFLGVRTVLFRALTDLERDAHACICVEIVTSVRPYVEAMGTQGAAWS